MQISQNHFFGAHSTFRERRAIFKDAAGAENTFEDPFFYHEAGTSPEGTEAKTDTENETDGELLSSIDEALQDPPAAETGANSTEEEDEDQADNDSARVLSFEDGHRLDEEETEDLRITSRERAKKVLPDPTTVVVSKFERWFRGVRALKNSSITLRGDVTKTIDTLTGHAQSFGENLVRTVQDKFHLTREKAILEWRRLVARPTKCDQVLAGIAKEKKALSGQLEAISTVGDTIPGWRVSSKVKAFINDRFMQAKQFMQEKMNIGKTLGAYDRAAEMVTDIKAETIEKEKVIKSSMTENVKGEVAGRDKVFTLLHVTDENRDEVKDLVNDAINEERGSDMKLRRFMKDQGLSAQQQRAVMILIKSMQSVLGEATIAQMEDAHNETLEEIEASKLVDQRKEKMGKILKSWENAKRSGSLVEHGEVKLAFQKRTGLNSTSWKILKADQRKITLKYKNTELVLVRDQKKLFLYIQGSNLRSEELLDDLQALTFRTGETISTRSHESPFSKAA